MRAAAFIQFGGIGLHPAPDATGIDLHTALGQKLGNVFVGERIPQIPPHAQNDHLARELAAFERIGWGDRHGILRYQTLSQTSQWNLLVSLIWPLSSRARNVARKVRSPPLSGVGPTQVTLRFKALPAAFNISVPPTVSPLPIGLRSPVARIAWASHVTLEPNRSTGI